MTTTKYIGAFIAAVATAPTFAQDSVLGAQNHTFGSRSGYIGTKIDLAKNQYKPGEPINYTLDVFAQTTNGKAVPVSGYEIVVKISPLETLTQNCIVGQSNCDDILFRTFPKDYSDQPTRKAPLTSVPEVNTTTLLPALAPGQYAVFTSGTIGGTPLTKAAYDVFTVVAETQPNLFAYFADQPWDLKVGRYGATKNFPKPKYDPLQGVTLKGNDVLVDRVNLSHNFEFKVRDENDCTSCDTAERVKRTAIPEKIALFAIHAVVDGNSDLDGDIDLCTSPGVITPLDFNQSYEVKQHARKVGKNGAGRTFDRADVTFNNPTITPFAGVPFQTDRSDSFYIVKAAYVDANANKTLDAGEKIVGIDTLAMEIDNKSGNVSAVAIGAFVLGAATGYFIPHPPLPGGNGPDTTPEPTGDGFDNFEQYDLITD